MKIARISGGRIVEFVEPVPGFDLAECYHPDIVAELVSVPNTAEIGWSYQNGKASPAPDMPAPTKAELVAYAADKRWQVEVGGIAVAGVPVQTDRSSQAMISGAVALCDKVPETIIRFKAADGFVDLDAATMTAIAIAVGQHVQAVFAIEATVRAAIEAGTITTTAQIDAAFEP